MKIVTTAALGIVAASLLWSAAVAHPRLKAVGDDTHKQEGSFNFELKK